MTTMSLSKPFQSLCVLALLAFGACSSSTEPTDCVSEVDAEVIVTNDEAPLFRWSPGCRVQTLQVSSADRDQVLWVVRSDAGIGSGVRYGTIPAGATQAFPPGALVVGEDYYLTITTVIGGDAIFTHDEVLFTR